MVGQLCVAANQAHRASKTVPQIGSGNRAAASALQVMLDAGPSMTLSLKVCTPAVVTLPVSVVGALLVSEPTLTVPSVNGLPPSLSAPRCR